MNKKVIKAIFLLIIGCMLNNIFLEYIIKLDPGAGNLITFCQFLFIALCGFVVTSKFGKVESRIPQKEYLKLVSLFFINSVLGNWMFAFHIPVPLMMIFRSGTLIANMIMGIIIIKRRYTLEKYISVLLVTVGIMICTSYSSNECQKKGCRDCNEILPENMEKVDYSFWFAIGVCLSICTLLLTATLSIFLEKLYKKYGKYDQESLYYTHLYGLIGFTMYHRNLLHHAEIAGNSAPLHVFSLNSHVPCIWVFLLLNAITQYMCISNVYVLFTECQSLTVTLVLTLRKLLSLIFSIIYFQNPFTNAHWIGTILVFSGTLIFSNTHYEIKKLFDQKIVQIKEK